MSDQSSLEFRCWLGRLFLVLMVQRSGQQACLQEPCQGGRPQLANGCCPTQAGQPCHPANGTLCDQELGYFCASPDGTAVVDDGQGLCRGHYQLQVTGVGLKNVSLAWSHFAPEGYRFEYLLLVREGSYHSEMNQWRIKEIGIQPFYTARRLNPATWYFMKIGVWLDARAQILGNTTETVMVESRAADFCEHRDVQYRVGERFIHECEDNCTCLTTGQFDCQPLCPEGGIPEVEEGCQVTSGDSCCEYRILCPVVGEACQLDGQTYLHGQEFTSGCRTCTCLEGQAECRYPDECPVMQPSAACPLPRPVQVDNQCCPEWNCANSCQQDNQTYGQLEYFTSHRCGLCQCDARGNIQCAPDCPPVEMVLPDAACPDPHIRQEGCCDTLFCHDFTLDPAQFIRRMFALAYSPVTLTLSFEVNPESEVDGIPLYCEYEILYANSSDPHVTWHRRRVQPVDVRLNSDQPPHVLDPMEALTRDTAIVVGSRAYVTLSGMYPNTTYYVRIFALDDTLNDGQETSQEETLNDGQKTSQEETLTDGQETSQEETLTDGQETSLQAASNISRRSAVTVVVKTLSLDNTTSCFHDGQEVKHGSNVSGHCGHTCHCHAGQLSCHSSCQSESVVLAVSVSCPHPTLEQLESDLCCPVWTCRAAARGCQWGQLLLESGQSVLDGCQVCRCENTSVSCVSVCPPLGPPPRSGCQMVNVSGHCCQQWQCPLEIQPPIGIKATVRAKLSGRCQNFQFHLLEDLKSKLKHLVSLRMGCRLDSANSPADLSPVPTGSHTTSTDSNLAYNDWMPATNDSELTKFCHTIDIDVDCPGLSEVGLYRKKRSQQFDVIGQEIPVSISIHMNYSLLFPQGRTARFVKWAGHKLATLLNGSFSITLISGKVLTSIGGASPLGESFLCEQGFAFKKKHCILSQIEIRPWIQPQVPLIASEVSGGFITLHWTFIEDFQLNHITALTVEFRNEADIFWLSSSQLSPGVTSYNLTSLMADHNIHVRLVAMTAWMGKPRWIVGQAEFRTLSAQSLVDASPTLVLTDVMVTGSCVFFYWDIPGVQPADLIQVDVLYKRTRQLAYQRRRLEVAAGENGAKLKDLDINTAYVAQIVVTLPSDVIMTSLPVHFVTSGNGSSTDLLLAVLSTCVVTAVASMLSSVCCLHWWRHRKRKNTGFENKTFGIQLDNSEAPTASTSTVTR